MSDEATVVTGRVTLRRCCLVLAAGMGARMGGPKALLSWRGRPLASAHAQSRRHDCARTIVVTRESIAEVLRRADASLELLVSEEPDALGPAGSIAAAVRSGALSSEAVVIVTPVDVLPASTAVVEALAGALGPAEAARPSRGGGRPGHPVACDAGMLRREYAHAARPLREVLGSLGDRCVTVPVQEPEAVRDLDTPEAWEAMAGSRPDFWR
ncbi:MAG TPA: NTP transferase domain-containing protein [Polyangiaceae bacterium]|nr:NTP transferase domain-containing protein [Polyangiaceae bacterium]